MQSFCNFSQRFVTALVLINLLGPSHSKAQSAPSITSQPTSQTVVSGANATYSVTATGQTPLSYQWSRNGTNLADSAHVVGSTNSSLTILQAVTSDAGSYQVVVTNRHGSITSSAATLTVLVPPSVTQQPASLTIGAGTNAEFAASAAGTAPLTNRWLFNGVPLSDGGRVSGATSTTLTIASAASFGCW